MPENKRTIIHSPMQIRGSLLTSHNQNIKAWMNLKCGCQS